jgi:hypothetical protein
LWQNWRLLYHHFLGAMNLMSENATVETEVTETTTPVATEPEVVAAVPEVAAAPEVIEELSYHAVEKDGKITAIWEMRGKKHVRTIDPRSEEGKHLLGHTDNPEAVQNATV